jgi:broad specificity phosphatase PhoE
MEKLIRFTANMRRSSPLIALHVVDEKQWSLMERVMSVPHSLQFGEVAGKHSDVTWELAPGEIEVLSTDPQEIAFFKRLGLHGNISLMDRVTEWVEEHQPEWLEESASCENGSL